MEQFLTLLLAAIGKTVESLEVQALFADQDITEELSVDDDDYETYVERPLLGYSFNITEQESIKNPRYNGQPNKILVLSGCHFNAEGHENYRQYRGMLPNQIDFEDSRDEIMVKLGDSVWKYEENGMVRSERWEYAETDRQLNIDYSKDKQRIKTVYFGIREFFTK